MRKAIQPISRQNLADDLAQRIKQLIQTQAYEPGSRLPSIAHMAQDFRVGAPTVREALKTLEAVGVVEIRHGSGVYVTRSDDQLVISNPVHDVAVSKKLLLDLIEARIPIELTSASLAAQNASAEQLDEMERLLANAQAHLDDDDVLNQTNMAFHRQIATASGNTVVKQLLEVLTSLFTREQRLILDIANQRRQDHAEHLGIYEALRRKDAGLATVRMRAHLEHVRDTLRRWDPSAHSVA
jgi:DNA-binding FadR family transcriptional regulator